MCGVFGFINCGDPWQRKFIAYQNRTRGTEGTGIAWPDTESGKWKHVKKGKDFQEFLDDKAEVPWDSPVLIGHLRRGSPGLMHVGGVCDKNAHPFRRGNILLAHNGYIRNWLELERTRCKKRNHFVDSDVLASMIQENGIESLSEVNGTSTAWFVDINDTTKMYLWCWKQDLAFASGEGWFAFSSNVDHLKRGGFPDAVVAEKNKGQLVCVDLATGEDTIQEYIEAADVQPPEPKGRKTYVYGEHGLMDVGDGRQSYQSLAQWNMAAIKKGADGNKGDKKGKKGKKKKDIESQEIEPDKAVKMADTIAGIPPKQAISKTTKDALLKDATDNVPREGEVFIQEDEPFPFWLPARLLYGADVPTCRSCGALTSKGVCHVCNTWNIDEKPVPSYASGHLELCEGCGAFFAYKKESPNCPNDGGMKIGVADEDALLGDFATAYYMASAEFGSKFVRLLRDREKRIVLERVKGMWETT